MPEPPQAPATGSLVALLSLNGRLVPADRPVLCADDRGLLLADGLFETMRAVGGRVPRLADHMARLRAGAAVLGLPVPKLLDEPTGLLARLLEANGLESAALRLTLTRGPGPRGLAPPEAPTPTLLVTAASLPAAPPPARVVVAGCTRRNERSPLAAIKSLAYLDQVLALREAQARGADDALLLNGAGRLTGATAANLFLVQEEGLLTPPVPEGALPGTTRARVLALAPALGLPVREQPLEPRQLEAVSAAFLTSALLLVRPIGALAGRQLAPPSRALGALAAALAADTR